MRRTNRYLIFNTDTVLHQSESLCAFVKYTYKDEKSTEKLSFPSGSTGNISIPLIILCCRRREPGSAWPTFESLLHPYQSGSLSPTTSLKQKPCTLSWRFTHIWREILVSIRNKTVLGSEKKELACIKQSVSIRRWKPYRRLGIQYSAYSTGSPVLRPENKLDFGIV